MEITLFTKCLFEFIGTLVLVLLGDGVVASTVLKQSKGFNGGWAVITIAWGLAVMCGVLIAGPYSGAHLNPAVSVGLAVAGSFPWAFVPGYIAAQLLGGFCGAVLVYVYYKDHFDATDDPATKLGVFCTMPAIMDKPRNLFCEFLGTLLYVRTVIAVLRKRGRFIAQKQLLITNIQGECKFIYLIACIVDIEFTRYVVSCH